jgi:sialate O-acetylesterase
VRVLDTGGYGGFSSAPEVLRAYREADPARTLALSGTWRFTSGTPLAEIGWPPSEDPLRPHLASVLWNGMLAPLVPFALRGAIWYQGEANCGRAEQYERLFPNLIRSWRAAFARELAFYYVQIAPFDYGEDGGAAARLRDAQRKTLAVANTGMAVTMDIGNPADIHPLKKREVGERLARWAFARTYGKGGECSGPLYRSARAEGAALRITFEHAAGLTSRGAPLRALTIAGLDRVFHPAQGRIDGETLLVSSPAVPAPLAVRFGWGAADETNLWNGDGLPASSFRSDDWQP